MTKPSLSVHPFKLLLLSVSIKLILFPTTPSTDLEVHRHWKALTTSLPLSKWYIDESSSWTLDYPPAFAYFEYLLGRIIQPLHPALVNIFNLNDASLATINYLRATVLVLDPVLIFSLYFLTNSLRSSSLTSNNIYSIDPSSLSILLVSLNPSLIIVDNIHFQYNSLPISLIFLTISALATSSVPLAATIFSLAVNTKHTIFPLALPLVCYVLSSLHWSQHSFLVILRTVFAALLTCGILWFPFISSGGFALMLQIKQRLLPLHRGLLHANWAPNFWAFYAVVDKALSHCGCVVRTPDVSITSGHIGAVRPFVCLPNPTPSICLSLAVIGTTPSLLRIMRQPSPLTLIRAIVITALSSVLFGWHVHEKALLIALLPLTVLFVIVVVHYPHHKCEAMSFLILSQATNLVVGDLVAQRRGMIFSLIFGLAYFLFVLALATNVVTTQHQGFIVMYAIGCALVELYSNGGGHDFLFGSRMPFIPKLIVSLYGFIGVVSSYGLLLM